MTIHNIGLCLIVPVILLSGCGPGTLSNSEAAKQLTAMYAAKAEERMVSTYKTVDGLVTKECGSSSCPEKFRPGIFDGESISQLESAGLLTTHLVRRQDIGFAQWRAFYSVAPTDTDKWHVSLQQEGNDLLISGKPRELQGVKVVAIGAPADFFGKKASIVKYRVDFKLTPFGKALRVNDGSKDAEAAFAL